MEMLVCWALKVNWSVRWLSGEQPPRRSGCSAQLQPSSTFLPTPESGSPSWRSSLLSTTFPHCFPPSSEAMLLIERSNLPSVIWVVAVTGDRLSQQTAIRQRLLESYFKQVLLRRMQTNSDFYQQLSNITEEDNPTKKVAPTLQDVAKAAGCWTRMWRKICFGSKILTGRHMIYHRWYSRQI